MNKLISKLLHGAFALILSGSSLAASLPDKPELLWRIKLGSEPSGTPAVSSDVIVAVATRGKIAAISPDGGKLWERTLEKSSFTASPIIHGTLAIIGSMEGVLYALDLKDGKTVWSYSTGGVIQGKAVSLSGDSAAVIDQQTGALHCVNTKNGKLKWKSEPTNRCDGFASAAKDLVVFGNCDAMIHIFSSDTGKKLRSVELGEEGQIAGGVAIDKDHAAAGTYGGDVAYVDIQKGRLIWAFTETRGSIQSTPAIDAKNVVTTSEAGMIYCLDRPSGALRWEAKIGGTPTSPLIKGPKIVITSDGVLYLLSLDSGEKLWSYEVSDEATSPALLGNMVIIAGDDGTVSAFGAKE